MGIKFGSWALNRHCKNIGRCKFGGLVRDRHTYICKYEILADFQLYGIIEWKIFMGLNFHRLALCNILQIQIFADAHVEHASRYMYMQNLNCSFVGLIFIDGQLTTLDPSKFPLYDIPHLTSSRPVMYENHLLDVMS